MAKTNWWDRNARNMDGFRNRPAGLAKKKAENNIEPQPSIATTPSAVDEEVTEVFRYFDKEEYAEAFFQGRIYISTLNLCRGYEDPLRGDRDEGVERYNSGRKVTGGSSDAKFVSMAAQAGIYIGPNCTGVVMHNNKRETRIHDAYVLCTTIGFSNENLKKTFGKYCVRISDVEMFHKVLTKSFSSKVGLLVAEKGPVVYKSRSYKEYEEKPGRIGFVKPPDKYATQKEYRFLWSIPAGRSIGAIEVSCPEAVKYLTRIS